MLLLHGFVAKQACLVLWLSKPFLSNHSFTGVSHSPLVGFTNHLCVLSCGCVQLFANPWTVAHQAPLSMEFSRQEYWRGLPCPPPGGLPNPGIEPTSLESPALAGRFFTTAPPGKPLENQKPPLKKCILKRAQLLVHW